MPWLVLDLVDVLGGSRAGSRLSFGPAGGSGAYVGWFQNLVQGVLLFCHLKRICGTLATASMKYCC